MKLTRLRVSGFKSFVDPIELPIEPGLTGVVGPNGCGKSNLLEALRWVMGESSAKSMRGDAMDDVIFAGSGNRPMRNVAEVVLTIDNSDRRAPSSWNEGDALEVARRIEREQGSSYKINGREARARDVQLFFADISSGAHSPAMVRQGQIGQLINAKPHQRRAILEEAAGISGLHARRHEAELKLNAAEANLARLADVVQEIEGQLASLKRQARQASRYRNISGQIRETEALVLHLKWIAAREASEAARGDLDVAQASVADLTQHAAQAQSAELAAQEVLPDLRQGEVQAAAALQRLNAERITLDTEGARARETLEALARTINLVTGDIAREEARAHDAKTQTARFLSEREELLAKSHDDATQSATFALDNDQARAAVAACEERADALTAALAEIKAKRASAERTLADARMRFDRMTRDAHQATRDLEQIEGDLLRLPALESVQAAQESAAAALSDQQQSLAQAEALRRDYAAAEARARQPLEQSEKELQNLKAEARALRGLLSAGAAALWPPAVDLVQVTPGFEAALAAALGDDLDVPVDIAAPAHWRLIDGGTGDALPEGVLPLLQFVSGPEALNLTLAYAGIVERAHGNRLQSQLTPGQRLVSREGDLWRWDGYVATADAATPAAQRLKQRNRLAKLDGDIAQLDAVTSELRAQWAAAGEAHEQARAQEHSARQALRQCEAASTAAKDARIKAEAQHAQADARRHAAATRRTDLDRLASEADEAFQAATRDLAALQVSSVLETEMAEARAKVLDARGALARAQAARDAFDRELRARQRRVEELANEAAAWSQRYDAANAQIASLRSRLEDAQVQHAEAQTLPALIAEKRMTLAGLLSEAEDTRARAADALALAEAEAKQTAQALKAIEAQLVEAREARARAEATCINVRERLSDVIATAIEVMDCQPEALLDKADVKAGAVLPPLTHVEAKAERLKRERETLGGVNLRADEEAQAAEERLTQLLNERADLEAAIQRLRTAISSLNREGRERLLEAFETVNANFQKLFTTLFQGGEARLTLTESDDPLEAGLDILAKPPGKRLQVMSLLSGGEQALTAMALIFAVFLVNPAPICVLDEVDAPLDDSNVERFCNLLAEMTRTTHTRFLVITHHALTMSRMDRLIGVTMQERGVSRLVSVDLNAYAQGPRAEAAE